MNFTRKAICLSQFFILFHNHHEDVLDGPSKNWARTSRLAGWLVLTASRKEVSTSPKLGKAALTSPKSREAASKGDDQPKPYNLEMLLTEWLSSLEDILIIKRKLRRKENRAKHGRRKKIERTTITKLWWKSSMVTPQKGSWRSLIYPRDPKKP